MNSVCLTEFPHTKRSVLCKGVDVYGAVAIGATLDTIIGCSVVLMFEKGFISFVVESLCSCCL